MGVGPPLSLIMVMMCDHFLSCSSNCNWSL